MILTPKEIVETRDLMEQDYRSGHVTTFWRERVIAILHRIERAEVAKPTMRETLFQRISAELDRAYAKHGADPWGRHEFYGVLLEEVDELWDAIKADADPGDVCAELVQVAAMCFRYYETGGRIGRVHP